MNRSAWQPRFRNTPTCVVRWGTRQPVVPGPCQLDPCGWRGGLTGGRKKAMK